VWSRVAYDRYSLIVASQGLASRQTYLGWAECGQLNFCCLLQTLDYCTSPVLTDVSVTIWLPIEIVRRGPDTSSASLVSHRAEIYQPKRHDFDFTRRQTTIAGPSVHRSSECHATRGNAFHDFADTSGNRHGWAAPRWGRPWMGAVMPICCIPSAPQSPPGLSGLEPAR